MSPIVSYAILAVAAIGAIVGWSNAKKGAPWGQPLTIVCAVLVIVLGFYVSLANSGLTGGGASKASQNREIEYQKIQTRVLGKYLAEKYSGKKAILLKDPQAPADTPYIVGLKEGLGNAVEIIEELSPVPPKSAMAPGADGGPEQIMEPMEVWFSKQSFDKLLKDKMGKADILITTVGLPGGVGSNGKGFVGTSVLKNKKVAFAGGSVYEHGAGLKAGDIIAAVTYKPNAEYDEKPVPKDEKVAFDKRYILITPENFNEVVGTYKEIFGR